MITCERFTCPHKATHDVSYAELLRLNEATGNYDPSDGVIRVTRESPRYCEADAYDWADHLNGKRLDDAGALRGPTNGET